MIDTATPEQWEEIEAIRQNWLDAQTRQSTPEEIGDAVARMWASLGLKPPRVEIVLSPKCLGKESYSSVWWQAWAGWYGGARVLGVEFDEEKYETFRRWCLHCTYVAATETLCKVSKRPIKILWRDAVLHCEDGPAAEWEDGFSLWAIGGVSVDEQIVMRPETQTIEQIHAEENEEARRVRIDRFGWLRYLEESDSKVIDSGRNDIDKTYEILADTPVGQRLITHCPSTGRRYSLGIPGGKVKTREEAQARLGGDRAGVIDIGRT